MNGAQLFATNQSLAALSTTAVQYTDATQTRINLGGAGGTTIANVAPGQVIAGSPTTPNGGTRTNDVTLVGNTAGPVALHNIAAGVLANDAVNLGQFNAGLNNTLSSANAYTDARIAQVGFDLGELRRESFAGTAGALAASGLPQVMDGQRAMIAGGVGHYRGETAFAIGISTAFNDGRAALKVAGTMDTRGKGGVSAGVGFGF